MIYVSDDSQQRSPVNLGTLYRICKCRADYLSKQAE
jgi:hypothetical protein